MTFILLSVWCLYHSCLAVLCWKVFFTDWNSIINKFCLLAYLRYFQPLIYTTLTQGNIPEGGRNDFDQTVEATSATRFLIHNIQFIFFTRS
eukprot:TRINITY_DN15709_c0_g1_i2.p1 TRINITY_DN15709_c0_g1~~TRINITY_DN15709_c0_g1_i2.p1  ORF type:complete len:104 (+),score=2.35 TRINITY_DN15709_c0_g1_i2:41-313(+)